MGAEASAAFVMGFLIGLSPGLVLVPWLMLRKHRHDFEAWFKREAL